MGAAAFVISIACVLWLLILIGAWFPPWPDADCRDLYRKRISLAKGESLGKYLVDVVLCAHIALPLRGLVVCLFTLMLCVWIMK